MENSSKFLYMAGTILISMFIIGIAVYLFRGGAIMSAEYHSKLSDEELKAYNAEFEAYAHKDDLLASDIVTVINKAYDINQKEANGEYVLIDVVVKDGYYKRTYKSGNLTPKGYMGSETSRIALYEFLKLYSGTKYENNEFSYKNKFKCTQV